MIFNWIKNFDVTKAVILACVGIVSSWYDVRGQVSLLKQEANIRWEKQDKKDAEQDQAARDIKADLREGIEDIKRTIREQNRNAKR